MPKVLKEFHHKEARQITEKTENRGAGREWEYPLSEEAMEAAGLHPIGVYIKRRQITIAERMEFRPIYALCTEAERMPGKIRLI